MSFYCIVQQRWKAEISSTLIN